MQMRVSLSIAKQVRNQPDPHTHCKSLWDSRTNTWDNISAEAMGLKKNFGSFTTFLAVEVSALCTLNYTLHCQLEGLCAWWKNALFLLTAIPAKFLFLSTLAWPPPTSLIETSKGFELLNSSPLFHRQHWVIQSASMTELSLCLSFASIRETDILHQHFGRAPFTSVLSLTGRGYILLVENQCLISRLVLSSYCLMGRCILVSYSSGLFSPSNLS